VITSATKRNRPIMSFFFPSVYKQKLYMDFSVKRLVCGLPWYIRKVALLQRFDIYE